MRIVVDIFQRDPGYVAIACSEGALLTAGRAAGGSTEAEAASQAVRTLLNERPSQPPQRMPLARYVAIAPREIRNAIEGAIHDRLVGDEVELTIDYRDAAGTLTTRRILPKNIRGLGGNDTLLSYDLDKEQPRTFVVSRIERVERDA